MSLCMANVSLNLHGMQLLENVSFTLSAGEVLTILGPNGAGKSTLLKALSGEWNIDSGKVLFNGRAIQQWPPEEKAQAMAILPQGTILEFPFTSEEVVMLGRTPHNTGLQRDSQIVTEVLDAVDGAYLRSRIYTQLSGGEKQRVQLARVLAQVWEADTHQDRFLILDEPTASFDLAHQQLTLDLVQQLARKGFGVIIVLHDLNLAARCATQMLLLNCGQVMVYGTPQQVLTAENINRVFGVTATIQTNPLTGNPLVIT